MKHTVILLALGLLLAGQAGLAQEPEVLLMEEEDRWVTAVGAVHQIYLLHHQALQRRADQETKLGDGSSPADDWRDGDSTGTGSGLRFSVGNSSGIASVMYIASQVDYENIYTGKGGHGITTDRRDLEADWTQITGSNERGVWGWRVGFRYLGLTEEIEIRETGGSPNSFQARDEISWYLLFAGYHGELRPFGGKYFTVHGNADVFLGEASGIARKGEDAGGYDASIDERYEDNYSVAYGLGLTAGVRFKVVDRLRVGVDYRREWMYSFEGTETGLVVFPDNNDALYIENAYSVYTYVDITF